MNEKQHNNKVKEVSEDLTQFGLELRTTDRGAGVTYFEVIRGGDTTETPSIYKSFNIYSISGWLRGYQYALSGAQLL